MVKILVVDDNEDNRIVLTRMLEFGGHTVATAADGATAIAVAGSFLPDLILMDLAMPDMDGWAATARLKADLRLRHIPVVVVTGHVTSDEILRAQRAGCQDVVSKPIDYYVLIQKVEQHTRRPRPAMRPPADDERRDHSAGAGLSSNGSSSNCSNRVRCDAL